MSKTTGFSDVDGSTRAEDLVEYLAVLADRLADARREGYGMLRLNAGAAVLDVGCGAGEVCVELAGLVGPRGRVAGIDPSEAMIAAARRAAQGSATSIELKVGERVRAAVCRRQLRRSARRTGFPASRQSRGGPSGNAPRHPARRSRDGDRPRSRSAWARSRRPGAPARARSEHARPAAHDREPAQRHASARDVRARRALPTSSRPSRCSK